MYIPQQFANTDQTALHAFMRRHGFATLVTQQNNASFASHVHLSLESSTGTHGTLVGHMARNNAQWQDLVEGKEVLVIFHGPHAYVSPAWYEPNPMAVPTWNYTAVHAYGRARILTEKELVEVLHRQTDENEQGNDHPWKLELTPAMRERMLGAIGGFEIVLERIEGKFKLSQNRAEQDRRNVIAHLSKTESGREVAILMNKELERENK